MVRTTTVIPNAATTTTVDYMEAPQESFVYKGMEYPEVPKKGTVRVFLLDPKNSFQIGIGSYFWLEKNITIGHPTKVVYITRQGKILDLEKEEDRAFFALLRLHPYVTGNNSKKLVGYMEPETNAEEVIGKAMYYAEAITWISKQNDEKLRDVADLLGLKTTGATPTIIKANVVKFAEDMPIATKQQLNQGLKGFLDHIKADDFDLRLLFRRLMNRGHIRYIGNQYKYFPDPVEPRHSDFIGANEDSVLDWMLDDDVRLATLQNHVQTKIKSGTQSAVRDEKIKRFVLDPPENENGEPGGEKEIEEDEEEREDEESEDPLNAQGNEPPKPPRQGRPRKNP